MIVTIQPQAVSVSVNPSAVNASFGNPIARDYVERDPYTGEYTITPSADPQVFQTRNLRMTDNITIEPIPQNYGLITWDGSTLMVS